MAHRPTGPLVATLAAVLTATLTACGTDAPAGAPVDAPDQAELLDVVTSTNVYGAVVRAVGGDLVEVTSLIDDPTADPHSYESTPADAAAVAGADLVVVNGGGYDDFMTRLVESSGGEADVIDVVALSGLAPAEDGEGHTADDGHEHTADDGHEHGSFNEHVWYSLPTVRKLAERLATDMGAADAANAATYTANAEQFSAAVDELATEAGAIATAAPGARVAATEPVPGYLLEAAGLTDVTPEAFTEAVEEDSDPPAAALAETLTLFGPPEPVAALIVNPQTATPSTDQVRAAAQTGGVPVVEFTETLPEGTTDYPTWMGAQIDALSAALNGN
ncbi:metal ABC transporter solute-binding protein, Zn/Mn family [Pseudonocardia lacus]|uniref:metal ABC transporter solute-binding protein, Zn/Mn family n=1 Tax=Pseudonocardia lacus TaxID=2835865 RepID=UPI001BDD1997|nr:zinc ABC transporter substrate-binding protein [Pseudonocardia lacus]